MHPDTQPDYEVAIIGAGFSGLGMAIQLKRHGHDSFVVLEKADTIGGTWRDNTYPGCACDVESHLYSFSFAPNADWSRNFAPQPEIREYLNSCADRFEVRPQIRLGANVTNSAWDDEAQFWRIAIEGGDEITARVFVPALGPLSKPAIPVLPGIEQFEGESWHSAQWNHDHDLAGKRVAVIGTGASAIQIVPMIAPDVQQLALFQRTPPWILPKADGDINEKTKRNYKRIPFLLRLARRAIYWTLEGRSLGFNFSPRAMRLGERLARANIASQIKDPELRRRVTPNYTMGCKRVLLTNDYYPALTRDNIELVTDPILRVTESGIFTADGTERPFDVLIYGTGFKVQDLIEPGMINGAGGVDLADAWAERGMQAYLGTAVAGFPNMFMMLGPNSALSHSSVVFMAECQIHYVLEALKTMGPGRITALDVRRKVQDTFNEGLQTKLNKGVWQRGGCHSWYQDASGRNTAIWPDFTFKFRSATRDFDLASYETVSPKAKPAAPAEAGEPLTVS